MTRLEAIFAELGVSHYLSDFIEQGFDTWDSILDITELDFDALGVKLGHRRKLQRKIASSRGLSPNKALPPPTRNTPHDDRQAEEQRTSSAEVEKNEMDTVSGPRGAKRRCRQHPVPDKNAPERPPSAYVTFSNEMREELNGQDLSFIEIAKLVGENWRTLPSQEKEHYKRHASSAKKRYNVESEYKKTSQYREYSQYKIEFQARQSNQQRVTDFDVAKRPKYESHLSTGSSEVAEITTSQRSRDLSVERIPVDSSYLSASLWSTHESHPSAALTLPVRQITKGRGSGWPPSILPTYQGSSCIGSSQPLPCREGTRQIPLQRDHPKASIDNKLLSKKSHPAGEQLYPTEALQYSQSSNQDPLPPPTAALRSSYSTNSLAFSTPPILLEPPLNRTFPNPLLFPQSSSRYEELPSLKQQAPRMPTTVAPSS